MRVCTFYAPKVMAFTFIFFTLTFLPRVRGTNLRLGVQISDSILVGVGNKTCFLCYKFFKEFVKT